MAPPVAAAAVEAGAGDIGEGEGVGRHACPKVSQSVMEALLAWVTGAWSVLAAGGWRSVHFGVIEFWGWASVAGYMALVEALPVMLQPLHDVFR